MTVVLDLMVLQVEHLDSLQAAVAFVQNLLMTRVGIDLIESAPGLAHLREYELEAGYLLECHLRL